MPSNSAPTQVTLAEQCAPSPAVAQPSPLPPRPPCCRQQRWIATSCWWCSGLLQLTRRRCATARKLAAAPCCTCRVPKGRTVSWGQLLPTSWVLRLAAPRSSWRQTQQQARQRQRQQRQQRHLGQAWMQSVAPAATCCAGAVERRRTSRQAVRRCVLAGQAPMPQHCACMRF